MARGYHAGESSDTPARRGRREETRVAKRMGGRLTPNSGAASPFAPLDYTLAAPGLDGRIRADHKTTSARGLRIDAAMLGKIVAQALPGEIPVLTVSFTHPMFRASNPPTETEWAFVPLSLFQELLEHVTPAKSQQLCQRNPGADGSQRRVCGRCGEPLP